MSIVDNPVTQFIRSFETQKASVDPAEAVNQFAENFLVVSPQGARCIRSADFVAILPRRRELFDQLGRRSTELMEIEETWLGDRYVVAKTKWRFLFRTADGRDELVDVDTTYLIDTGTNPFQINLYLAHQDLMAVLAERGIKSPH